MTPVAMTLYVQKLESRSVPKKIKTLPGIGDDQSAISKNDHVYLSVACQHDRLHLTGKRPQKRSQGPQKQQSTPSYCLLTTTFECRRLTTGGTCLIQPSRPRGRSYSQCCCVNFPGAVVVITTTSSSLSHACACHVYIHRCMYVYLPKFRNKCTSTVIPTAVPSGLFHSFITIWLRTKYDANLEIVSYQVLFYQSLHISRFEQ